MRGHALLTAAAILTATGAMAQIRTDDVVVMRRTVAPPTGQAPSQLAVAWKEGEWGAWNDTCSPNAERTRTVECLRSDGVVRPQAECSGSKPVVRETDLRTEGCTFAWATGEWSAYGSTCAKSTSRSRTVACNAQHAGQPATAFQVQSGCPAPAPTSTESDEVVTGCSWDWQITSTGNWGDSCSATNTRPVTAVCKRSDGETVPDAQCASKGSKPTTESAASCDIVNGGFEKGTTENWYYNRNPFALSTAPVRSGRYSAMMDSATTSNMISVPVRWPTSNNGFRLSFWFFIPETNEPLPAHCSGEIRSNFIGGIDYKDAPKGVWVQRSTLNSYKGYPRQAGSNSFEIVASTSCNDSKSRPIYIDDVTIEIFN